MEPSPQRKPNPEKLLVTGVDGIVGASLALSLADRFRVLGLFGRHPVFLPGCAGAPWEPADPPQWTALMRRQRPQWIIHCGPLACSSWDIPEGRLDGEDQTRTCRLLAEVSAEVGSRLTVISSDAVFAGPRLFHDEKAPTGSRQPFALAVRQAEEELEATGALVVRTHAYGWAPAAGRPGFAEQVWHAVIEAAATPFDSRRHATPILASDLAELLWLAYRRRLQGRYHVAGAERTSAYRFAIELAVAFGLRSPAPPADQDPLRLAEADHLHETSLSTLRARRELGRAMPMLREGLDRFAEQARNGFRARLQCGNARTAAAADVA